MPRTLNLRREHLAPLGEADLARVGGGDDSAMTCYCPTLSVCVTQAIDVGTYNCPTFHARCA